MELGRKLAANKSRSRPAALRLINRPSSNTILFNQPHLKSEWHCRAELTIERVQPTIEASAELELIRLTLRVK
jgi:hypothetical protein